MAASCVAGAKDATHHRANGIGVALHKSGSPPPDSVPADFAELQTPLTVMATDFHRRADAVKAEVKEKLGALLG